MDAFYATLGVVCVIFAVTTIIIYRIVHRLSRISLSVSSDTKPPKDADEWAVSSEFEFIGNFSITVILPCIISAWRRLDRPTFFSKYTLMDKNIVKIQYNLVTIFEKDIVLTTSSTKDEGFFPCPPGSYMQNFSSKSFDQRWHQHLEMENYLMDAGQVQLIDQDINFEQYLIEVIRRQMEFIRTLPFWPFRGLYWHFIRRYIWRNKSIKTQHERGMIKLPNELSPT
jgi:hypothetical protein